jgi:hypothetical protein
MSMAQSRPAAEVTGMPRWAIYRMASKPDGPRDLGGVRISTIRAIALGRMGFRFSGLEVIEMRGKRKLKVVAIP